MLHKLSLKIKLILGAVIAIIIPFSVAGTIIYLQLSRTLIEMTFEKSEIYSRNISQIMNATILPEIKMASYIASLPQIVAATVSGDYKEVQEMFEAMDEAQKSNLYSFFLLDRNGIAQASAISKNSIGMDFSDREYFLKAKNLEPNISKPIFSREPQTLGELFIIIASPVIYNGSFSGMVAVPFMMDYFIELMNEKRVGESGYAYLIDSDGLVLIHPDKNIPYKINIYDLDVSENLKDLLRNRKEGKVQYFYNGSLRVAAVSHMKDYDWSIVFAQDTEEILLPVKKILFTIVIVAVFFLVLGIVFISYYLSRVGTPIQNYIKRSEEINRNAHEMIFYISDQNILINVNPAFEKITGLSRDDIIGTKDFFRKYSDIEDESIWEVLKKGKPWSGNIKFKTKNNPEKTISVLITPMRNKQGVAENYFGLGRDITQEIVYEKRVQQTQKLEAIGTLAGGIAHDFNNILGGILGYSELSLMSIDDKKKTKEYISEIIKGTDRAKDLIRQILTFSRKNEAEPRELHPQIIVKEALKLLRPSISSTISIKTKLNNSCIIIADPIEIHQLFMNIFTNAVYAIGDKEGEIILELDDFLVDPEYAETHPGMEPGEYLHIRVSDTGQGIKQEILENIFDPFFTTKPTGEGTGLGLSVVHGIIKKLGGSINVYSELDRGTVFNILIPSSISDEKGKDNNIVPPAKGSGRILLVDDEEIIVKTVSMILGKLGYEVKEFTDSTKALSEISFKHDSFDLIIADYAMPDITGLDILMYIKEKKLDLPVIIMSGFLEQAVEDRLVNAGVKSILIKPVNRYQLAEAVAHIVK